MKKKIKDSKLSKYYLIKPKVVEKNPQDEIHQF